MERKENILQELREISSTVAGIGSRNVYSVPAGYFDALGGDVLASVQFANRPVMPVPFSIPAGYFDQLAGTVLQQIRAREVFEELEQAPPLIHNGNSKKTYGIPLGYFDDLASTVIQRIHAAEVFEEMEQITTLFYTNPKTSYTVPEGYFNSLEGIVIERIRAQEQSITHSEVFEELRQFAPLFNTINKKGPYSVPANYFENLASSTLSAVEYAESADLQLGVFEELEQIAPLLNSISKKSTYTVPSDYFRQFSINSFAEEKQETRVVPLGRTKTRWVAWLAAACVTGLVVLSGYLFKADKARVAEPLNFTKSLAEVSDTDISNYLNSMPAPGIETIPTSVLDEQAPDIEPSIQNMSTEEIKDYLDKNSDPGEKSLKDI